MTKHLILVPLIIGLMACASTQSSDLAQRTFSPENFNNNPRIVLRDVTASSSQGYKTNSIKRVRRELSPNISIRETYGTSINDSFNGVSHTEVQRDTMQPVSSLAAQSQPLPARPSPVNVPQGTTYVPLTFPIPPPKDMMEKFHMHVGETQ